MESNLTPSNHNQKLINSKEDFLNYIAVYHKTNSGKLQKVIDTDWSFLQKVFGQKKLIKIAQDQRILQVKNRFDMMNQCDAIIHDVIVGALKQKAQVILTNEIIKEDKKLREDLDNMLRDYLKNIDDSRKKFINYLIEKESDIEKYKNSKLAYEPYIKAILFERDVYFSMQMERTENLKKKLNKIEAQFS